MKIITPTLAICLAGGLAAGIGLARPAQPAPIATAPPPSVSGQPAAGGTPARSEPIEIVDFAFNDVTVAPGSIVEVRNVDGLPHTVTAQGVFDTGTIDGSSAATFPAPTTPGTYAFICTLHPGMQGTLTVE